MIIAFAGKKRRLSVPACRAAILVFTLFCFTLPVPAKSHLSNRKNRIEIFQTPVTSKKIHQFETIVRPFFEKKAGRHSRQLSNLEAISDMDMMFLAKNWSRLSAEFRELYLSSLNIPAGFLEYISPGGNFEVYYTTSGPDAVSTLDQYRFSSADWRDKQMSANGIPDYIDEVAWAMDSSWSMEVLRFGYKEPYAYIDAGHPSALYKVIVLDATSGNADLYGMTYPAGQVTGGVGMRSFIELRNDWSAPEWGVYNSRPNDAARITCAHEFFHAIQYSMGHDNSPSYIDYFPAAWLEGTAVLMEELAFSYIDDYLQYLEGYDGYFGNPKLSVLTDEDLNYAEIIDPYANIVIALHLYWRAFSSPSMAFIKTLFTRNEQNSEKFSTNIASSAVQSGTTWPSLLNEFHLNSFFSGSQADTLIFIPEADKMPKWNYSIDSLDKHSAVTKNINRYAMETFARIRGEIYAETLFIQFAGSEAAAGGNWAAGAILIDTSGAYSKVPMPLESSSSARISIPEWGGYDEICVIASNANAEISRDATVYFTDSIMENLSLSESFDVYPNPVFRQSHGTLHIEGKNIIEIFLYSVDGKLVASADTYFPNGNRSFQKANNGFDWTLCNKNGEPVVPGTYIAVVGYKDLQKNKLKRSRTSILVLP